MRISIMCLTHLLHKEKNRYCENLNEKGIKDNRKF